MKYWLLWPWRCFFPLDSSKLHDGCFYYWHLAESNGPLQSWTPRGMTEFGAIHHMRRLYPGAWVVYVDRESKVIFFRVKK
jgi:hypothetical protein